MSMPSHIPKVNVKTKSCLPTILAITISISWAWYTLCHKTVQLLKHRRETGAKGDKGKARHWRDDSAVAKILDHLHTERAHQEIC